MPVMVNIRWLLVHDTVGLMSRVRNKPAEQIAQCIVMWCLTCDLAP